MDYVTATLTDPCTFYSTIATPVSPLEAYEIDAAYDALVFGDGSLAPTFTGCATAISIHNHLQKQLTPYVTETQSTPPPPTPLPPAVVFSKSLSPCTPDLGRLKESAKENPEENPKENPSVAPRPYSNPAAINPTLLHVTVKATVEPAKTLPVTPIPRTRRFLNRERPQPLSTPPGGSRRRKSSMVQDSLPSYIRNQLRETVADDVLPTSVLTLSLVLPIAPRKPPVIEEHEDLTRSRYESLAATSQYLYANSPVMTPLSPPKTTPKSASSNSLDFDEEYIPPGSLTRIYESKAKDFDQQSEEVDFITVHDSNDDMGNDYLFNM